MTTFLLALAQACFAQTPGEALESARELETPVVAAASEVPMKAFELTAFVLRGSLWDQGWADRMLAETVEIYAQCSVRVSRSEVKVVDAPGGRVHWKKYGEEGERGLNELRKALPHEGLTVYLLGSFEDAPEVPGFSVAHWTNGGYFPPEQENTVFLGDYAATPKYFEERKDSPYSLLAHELLHVLTREGQHYNLPEKNLLNIWKTRSNKILPEHCGWVRESPLVR